MYIHAYHTCTCIWTCTCMYMCTTHIFGITLSSYIVIQQCVINFRLTKGISVNQLKAPNIHFNTTHSTCKCTLTTIVIHSY